MREMTLIAELEAEVFPTAALQTEMADRRRTSAVQDWVLPPLRTQADVVRLLQSAASQTLGINLMIDGIPGPATRAALGLTKRRFEATMSSNKKIDITASVRAPAPLHKFPLFLDNVPFGTHQLLSWHKHELDDLARIVSASFKTARPLTHVEFAGHTDSVGSDTNNYLLGCRRAWAAFNYFHNSVNLDRGTVDKLKFRILSYGEKRAVQGQNQKARRIDAVAFRGPFGQLEVGAVACKSVPLLGRSPPYGKQLSNGKTSIQAPPVMNEFPETNPATKDAWDRFAEEVRWCDNFYQRSAAAARKTYLSALVFCTGTALAGMSTVAAAPVAVGIDIICIGGCYYNLKEKMVAIDGARQKCMMDAREKVGY